MESPCTLVNFEISFLFLSFFAVHQRVLSDLIIKPVDSESLVNETTYFNCSSSITNAEIYWFHYPVGAEPHERSSVYANEKFYGVYRADFVLHKNVSNGTYNIVIRSVKRNYAGRYECQDNGGLGEGHSAQLIVLDDELKCESNINPHEVIGPNVCGIQPDELRLSCSVPYHGNIPPQLQWLKSGKIDSISENVTEEQSHGQFTYNVTVKADQLKDKSSYECQTTKSRTSKPSCASGIVTVLYICGTSSLSEKSIGEVVNCSANTNSRSCQYKWISYNKEESLTVSNNRILKVEKEGVYRCEATCNLRDKPCTVIASLINATLNSNYTSGSGGMDSGGSSATKVWVPVVVGVLLIVAFFLLILFFIFWWRQRLKALKQGERTAAVDEFPLQYTEPLLDDYRILEEGKKVEDGTNPVAENSTVEAQPLLKSPGKTADNPINISDNADPCASPDVEHPGKRKKTEELKNEETKYDLHTKLLHVESLESGNDDKTVISGLAVLDKELFVAFENKSEVKVFQAITFSPVRSFVLKGLGNPLDMVSSPTVNALYISSSKDIHRVDANGKVITKWSIEEGGGTLSVTDDLFMSRESLFAHSIPDVLSIILSDWKRTALREYSADGELIHEVRLPSDVRPFHAVKTRFDDFVVSLEHRMVHKVAIFDTNGAVIHSFSGILKFPKYLVVNSDGYVFVAEQKNSRVLMMSPTLDSSKVLLSQKDNVGRPQRICLDEENSRMFVADNKTDNHRFMVFKLQNHKIGANEPHAVNHDRPKSLQSNSVQTIEDSGENSSTDAPEAVDGSRGEKRKR